ncbi:MAG: SDR family NAD(P)-dependent oxidoreductase [Sphingopyxis sp.]|uniref:SDR family NAD(P)-dependent oxidoreductase n=1 Tax=Sphingopyxis sp. TaxID=1908224 RepID=UPI003D6C9606
MPTKDFADKVAIVTGGTRGIGRTLAGMLLDRGARVVVVGRDAANLDEALAGLAGRGVADAAGCLGDIASASTAQAAVDVAIARFGRLDILANIAGWFPTATVEDTTDAQYAETIAANLTGTFMFCRAALPQLRKQAGGAIVNMSSTAARFGTPGLAAYGASKAAVEGLTRALAVEAAPDVRVNAVSAGPTLTDTVRALVESDTTGAVKAVTQSLPLQRMAEPEEIAEAVLFLASDRASIITGQVLHANAGGIMA